MKNIAIFFMVVGSTLSVYSQVFNDNAVKYWFYRDRLKYFVYPGTDEGNSVLMTSRNSNGQDDDIAQYNGAEWGQTRKINGYYIGLLATEYKLLKDNGQIADANVTLYELNLALDALIRMDNCEDIEPWNYPFELYNGFFIRNDVPPILSSSMTDYFNQGLISGDYSDYVDEYVNRRRGYPFAIESNVILCSRKYESENNYFYLNHDSQTDGFENLVSEYANKEESYWNYWKSDKFISNDEIVGTFMGLALVAKCVDNPNIKYKAIEIAQKILTFATGEVYPFQMSYPDMDYILWPNGGNSLGIYYALGKSVDKMFGLPTATNALGFTAYSSALAANVGSNIGNNFDRDMYIKLVSISGATGMNFNASASAIITILSRNNQWNVMYLLLYGYLFDKDMTKEKYGYPFSKLLEHLSTAPCGGPHKYKWPDEVHYLSNGWAVEYKYDADLNSQNLGSDRTGVFPGVDYMLLYNLACLAFPHGFDYEGQHYSFPSYVNQNNRNISAYYPMYYPFGGGIEYGSTANPEEIKAISTIETDMVVSNEALFPLNGHYIPGYNGDVSLKAGESIKLTDGFRVDAGAHFLARIESYSCGWVSYKNMAAPPWSENYRGCYYDTLISVPMEKRAPIVYSEDSYEEEDFDMPLWEDFYMYDTTAATELAVGVWLNPNPCGNSATLTVVSENEQQLTIELYDMTGVKRETVFSDIADLNLVLDLNLSSYASGTYMLRITGSGGVKVLRFVKE
ncbi:MAG: hypothetical protein A2W93_05230 [Bacteroidetes bacterium GWF2_43_63]|nr:MAG: hypothetical protein A2W94_11920 [Bacteroidetes bacterium GWE2_42_42]OFY56277.1 MAG: hypothetical protein A2W93_05230 [Bacteroidetes bacterium GWF2_43_63]HBG71955.1 hypothetical protein [Bacteroidales bacterium]HCB61856.1 hypothetical protein [Bacteroidales bacterium]HCY23878.1 hypothetical protein [Bacteroidales bacterium]